MLLKRGLIVLRPGPHECDIFEHVFFFFFCFFFLFLFLSLFVFFRFLPRFVRTELLRVVWRAVSKRCGFGELNLFRAVKKKHLRLQKYPDLFEPGLRHTVETVHCQQSLGIIARVCMLNASERGKRAREKTEREGGSLFLLSLYLFSSRLVCCFESCLASTLQTERALLAV